MGGISSTKIRAFTILEVVITLALSSLIIIIAYTGYNFTRKYYLQQKKEQQSMEQSHLLNYLLNSDTYLSSEAHVNEDTLIFKFHNQKRVRYSIQDSLIIRQQLQMIDSFEIDVQKYAYFNQKEQVNSGLIDQIIFEKASGTRLVYEKSYPANIKMSNN